MATERVAEGSRVARGPRRDSLVRIVSFMGARRRELKAAAGERLLLLEGRDARASSRLVDLDARLGRMAEQLELLERARVVAALRAEQRRKRIVALRQQVQILRARAGAVVVDVPEKRNAASMHRLGSALMYLGGLLLLWDALLELGLALGLT